MSISLSPPPPRRHIGLAALLLTGLFGSLAWYQAFVGAAAGATVGLFMALDFWPATALGALLGWTLGALLEARQIERAMRPRT